jgi:hypothetical protein
MERKTGAAGCKGIPQLLPVVAVVQAGEKGNFGQDSQD